MIRFLTLALALLTYGWAGAHTHNKKTKDLLYKTRLASYSDSVSVFTAGEKCITEARKQGNQSAEAEVYIYYGNYHFYVRKLNEAKKYFNKALALGKKAGDSHIQILARIRLTYTRQEEGQ